MANNLKTKLNRKGILIIKKFKVILVALLLLLHGSALADRDIQIKPNASDLQVNELREIAVAFFSKKCGINKELLHNANIEICLMQNESLHTTENGNNEWVAAGNPQWFIHISSFPGTDGEHEGYHLLRLTREGKLISWQAHGAEYTDEEPDIIKMGDRAIPMEADAQEAEIIANVKRDLSEFYNVDDVDTYLYQAVFLYEEHFNNGNSPVWIIYVYRNDALVWKGAYGYNGCRMSLVLAEQDYQVYNTPGEDFFVAVYGNDWWNEAYRYSLIQDENASDKEIKEWINEWKPFFLEWKTMHHYSPQCQEIESIIQKYERY